MKIGRKAPSKDYQRTTVATVQGETTEGAMQTDAAQTLCPGSILSHAAPAIIFSLFSDSSLVLVVYVLCLSLTFNICDVSFSLCCCSTMFLLDVVHDTNHG